MNTDAAFQEYDMLIDLCAKQVKAVGDVSKFAADVNLRLEKTKL